MPWDYRQVWSRGSWVSAHPDVILKMGVKQVLHRTRHLGWGTDTHLYRTAEARRDEFPSRLQSTQPRVPKQNRGNGGQGVWKVEAPSEHADKVTIVRVLHALRGSVCFKQEPDYALPSVTKRLVAGHEFRVVS
jgi:hypothetical protein